MIFPTRIRFLLLLNHRKSLIACIVSTMLWPDSVPLYIQILFELPKISFKMICKFLKQSWKSSHLTSSHCICCPHHLHPMLRPPAIVQPLWRCYWANHLFKFLILYSYTNFYVKYNLCSTVMMTLKWRFEKVLRVLLIHKVFWFIQSCIEHHLAQEVLGSFTKLGRHSRETRHCTNTGLKTVGKVLDDLLTTFENMKTIGLCIFLVFGTVGLFSMLLISVSRKQGPCLWWSWWHCQWCFWWFHW